MNISQTSTAIASYSASKEIVSTINKKVEDYVRSNEPCSRNDIQRALNLTARQSGCAVWHLIKTGAIIVRGFKEDSETKRQVETLVVNREPQFLFPKKGNAEKLAEIKKVCEKGLEFCDVISISEILSIINS